MVFFFLLQQHTDCQKTRGKGYKSTGRRNWFVFQWSISVWTQESKDRPFHIETTRTPEVWEIYSSCRVCIILFIYEVLLLCSFVWVSNLVSHFEECNLRVFEDQMLKRIFECKRRKLPEDLKKSVLEKNLCQIPTVPVVYDAEDHTILHTSAVYLALVVAQGDRRWLSASIR